MEIGKFIPVDKLAESGYAEYIQYLAAQLYLPTEWVITKPQICEPLMARVFKRDLYLSDGEAVTYDEIRRKSGGQPVYTSDLTAVYFWEVWEDQGDDGHVDFMHRGYMFSTIDLPSDRVYPLDEMRLLNWR